jgi:hypothetical protein
VNVFVLGWSPRGAADGATAERALRVLLDGMPFFDAGRIECWRAPSGRLVVACVAHEPERVGGVRYVDADDDGIALFSGRPFAWTGDAQADGREPLDAAYYRRPRADWQDTLDGRCCAVRYDDRDGTLELYADPLGSYPVYAGDAGTTRWISNSAEAVRAALGAEELDPAVLAGIVAAGWSLGGDPVWKGVRRLRDPQRRQLGLDELAAMGDAGFEARRTADRLVAATGALADWPGRPTLLQLSGGRDSRMVLGAALAAGADISAVTSGSADAPDVQIARELCAARGIAHDTASDPARALRSRPAHAARIVALASGATISLEHAAGYPFEPTHGELPLWLNGQGGELAGGYYRPAPDNLVGALFAAVADEASLLSARGRELVEGELRAAVDEQLDAGVAPRHVGDVFYLERRMGAWAAAGHGCVEVAKGDTTAPLWSRRLLPDQLGAARDGGRDHFARATLDALDPELAAMAFSVDRPGFHEPEAYDLTPVLTAVRGAVAAQPDHPAWEVLDRPAVERTLADGAAWARIWRLATVFMGVGARGS